MGDYLFHSRQSGSPHLSARQYARIVKRWIGLMGADPQHNGTHSLRRTRATLIYRQTKDLRAVQLLLGRREIESTMRQLGVEVDDTPDIAEHIECRGKRRRLVTTERRREFGLRSCSRNRSSNRLL
ncbi:tyrosine-type recombinase/integrase [Thiocapsa marina]|uniref:Tyr recombinase domain-containing protein n=1 Tax=Thiocapsa marina 5811 TaxID=768671 RepID=F9UC02_9GAMM|nr:hypothetical protein ThimaDRAFT_2454 [Thiocapsa marina 5811]